MDGGIFGLPINAVRLIQELARSPSRIPALDPVPDLSCKSQNKLITQQEGDKHLQRVMVIAIR